MAGGTFNNFLSYLHDFVNPGSNNKIVIDRRTIEKTWKYMDKVSYYKDRWYIKVDLYSQKTMSVIWKAYKSFQ